MGLESFLYQAFVYLLAAVVSVPIAKRLGLGSVLGYLIAGAMIGPFVFGLVGDEGTDIMHFAEFGVVMMLFIVGLELRPTLLWSMRKPIVGLGGLQVVLTTFVLTVIALAIGLDWRAGLAIGMTLALSSTAIVLQSLTEKGLIKTEAGQSAFAVLLFQDIAVIPILAVLPLLAVPELADTTTHARHDTHGSSLAPDGPPWLRALMVFGAVAIIVLAGRFVMRPIFRFIAETRLRELFTATALLLVIGTALLMQSVGLSPALGTFLAGVVLAESEYRHELETDIEPFKGLLLGLFFISVGASIDFALVAAQPWTLAAVTLGLMAIKLTLLLGVGSLFGLSLPVNTLFAFALAQGGEFAFVLFSFALSNGVLAADVVGPLVAAVALSMAITPLLLLINERLIQPRLTTRGATREADTIDDLESSVVIAGFGRFGMTVGRLLLAAGIRPTVLDHDARQIESLRRFGYKVYYGDATRSDLLEAAGCKTAKVLVIAVDDQEAVLAISETARRHFPHLHILARARDRRDAYDLLDMGITDVYRETLGSALSMGVAALRAAGMRAHRAHRMARAFQHHDSAMLRDLAAVRKDSRTYLAHSRARAEEISRVLGADRQDRYDSVDHAWGAPPVRPDADED